MRQFFKYIRILLSYILGLILSLLYRIKPAKRLCPSANHPQLIVSVTSYGRRVAKVLRYPLLSILHQTRRPDRIVVWLDNDHFSDENIPSYLRRMISEYGIEVKYCEDLKSYKKLVPSLREFPEDIIVTIDDDQVYDRHTLEELWNMHMEHPESIICPIAHVPVFESGNLKPYFTWKLNVKHSDSRILFPVGAFGVLYPPHSLFSDATDSSLFTSLSPHADDVWFWFMGLMNHRRVYIIGNWTCRPIDLAYQLIHRDDSLMKQNLLNNRNDVQIEAVLEHYGVSPNQAALEGLLDGTHVDLFS